MGKRWVLNVDLKDFFPSIHLGRIRGALMARPFLLPQECATVLAQLCTTDDGRLPQGAPTSPIIANIVCARLDGDLTALAKRYRLSFTRYCDDLSFSTRQHGFPADIAVAGAGWVGEHVSIGPALQQVIDANGFVVNPTKTRLQLSSCRQEVTGLTVNVFANVPRRFVRALRAMLYNWRVLGLRAAAAKYAEQYHRGSPIVGPVEERFKRVLRGRTEYLGMVRGRTDPVYCKLRNSLHALDPALIAAAPPPTAYRVSVIGRGGDVWTRVFGRVQDRILHLVASTPGGERSATAFVMNATHLATAAHNLGQTQAVTVHASGDSWTIDSAFLHLRGSRDIDAALLAASHGLAPLTHTSRIPNPGEQIAVIGFATIPGRRPGLGLYVGTVESIGWNFPRTIEFIHISVVSGGGLSGSPMFDIDGRLLGILIESLYEQTARDVPHREYCSVLPIKYVLEISGTGTPRDLPITEDGET